VCGTNPVEVKLAQHLYNEIKKYKRDEQKLSN